MVVNTNGVHIAEGDRFLSGLAKLDPVVYFQFDVLRRETYDIIRREEPLDVILLALGRMQQPV